MNLSSRVLGKTIVTQLERRIAAPVLRIGSDNFRLSDLAGVSCFNFTAARNLDSILNAELHVRNTRDLFDSVHPRELALPGLGAISFAVLGAAFEVKNIGGDRPLESWVTKHRDESARREFLTFSTMKHQTDRDAKAAAEERRAKKRRKSARRDQAHRIRTERFTERQNGSES